MSLSFSRAELYENCKRSFDLRYNQRVPEPAKSEALLGGSLFHAMAEDYGKALSLAPSADRGAVIEDTVQHSVTEGLPYELIQDIHSVFTGWAKRTPMEFPDQSMYELKLAFTKEWKVCEWDADDAFLRMVIDRVDLLTNPTSIIDYKSTRAIQTPKELQQLIYAFGLNLALDDEHRDFQVAEQYVRFGVPMKFRTVTYDDYKHIGDYLLKLSDEIDSNEDWEPSICGWCSFCAYSRGCPKYQEEIAGTDLDVTNMEQAVNLAEKTFASDARSAAAKKVLKAFTAENGVAVFGDQEYGPKTSESVKFDDLVGLEKELAEHEIDIWKYMGLTSTNFNKMVKDKTLRAKLIEDHASISGSSKFAFRKHK